LKWVPQAQFAGYYVAQEKGFYKEEGLDVTIKPGGTDISRFR
jgi:NitT/TauT family transport system substrate-binding protein